MMSESHYPQGWQPPPASDSPSAPPPKKHRKWPWILGGVVAVIVTISVATNTGGGNGTSVSAAQPAASQVATQAAQAPQVAVPTNLDGKTLGAAAQALEALGITQYSVNGDSGLQSAINACKAEVEKCTTLEVTSIDEAGQEVDPSDSVNVMVKAVIPPGGANSITQDGTYVVGKDIKAGTWHTDGQSDLGGCYWERDRNLDGDLGSIIANNDITGPSTVSVHSSDKAFQVSGDCVWTRE
jgi:hypothetical protein